MQQAMSSISTCTGLLSLYSVFGCGRPPLLEPPLPLTPTLLPDLLPHSVQPVVPQLGADPMGHLYLCDVLQNTAVGQDLFACRIDVQVMCKLWRMAVRSVPGSLRRLLGCWSDCASAKQRYSLTSSARLSLPPPSPSAAVGLLERAATAAIQLCRLLTVDCLSMLCLPCCPESVCNDPSWSTSVRHSRL